MTQSHNPLTEAEMGASLSRFFFPDVYERANFHKFPYFFRINQLGQIELIFIYGDIDEFSENEDATIELEFSSRESQWIVMLWMKLPGKEPVGYPFLFDTRDAATRKQAQRFLGQEEVSIHYMAWEGNHLWYIFKEDVSFKQHIEEGTRLFFYASQYDDGLSTEEEEWVEKTMTSSQLPSDYLEQEGLSIYLNYGALVEELGEEKAREKVMTRAFRGIRNIKGDEYLLWVGNRKNHRLSITLTPGFFKEGEHPLLPFFMFLPEYEKAEKEKPGSFCDIPIVSVQEGILTFIEWNGG